MSADMSTPTRVLAEGQWLGTGNQIIRVEWFPLTGWTATDSTGARYQQRPTLGRGNAGPVIRDGLRTADTAQDSEVAL
jgi:hypothetical protein